ncbi:MULTISPECIES: hypothetical protein [Bacillus]|uniref:hypothetical protein n=1 Tax=Bacillus TaxID=1386 RepID=UPI001ABE859F|nr:MULTISPECIES: hypothetical protein [Bacillus]MBR7817995.1 hypothetical protein [Bacillus sp. CCNWLCWHY013]MDJ0479945.1 hypothetical protein [Bacillus amyloliquefaciens]QTG87471.1 hypothetical protein J4048_21820 [Bacillus amyloliquefaciens]
MEYFLLLILVLFPFVWGSVGRGILDGLDKISDKRELPKKFNTSKKLIKEYLKIQKNLRHKKDAIVHCRNQDVSFRTLLDNIEDLLDVLSLEAPRFDFTNKNDLLVRNFPQAYFKVYIQLIRYNDSLNIIFDQLISLIYGDYDDPHIKDINALRDEVTEIIVSIRREAENIIKPYRREKNELFKVDVKHAKEIIEYEKQFIKEQRAALKNVAADNSILKLEKV